MNQETTPILTEDLSCGDDDGEDSSFSSTSNSMAKASIDPEQIKEIVTATVTEMRAEWLVEQNELYADRDHVHEMEGRLERKDDRLDERIDDVHDQLTDHEKFTAEKRKKVDQKIEQLQAEINEIKQNNTLFEDKFDSFKNNLDGHLSD